MSKNTRKGSNKQRPTTDEEYELLPLKSRNSSLLDREERKKKKQIKTPSYSNNDASSLVDESGVSPRISNALNTYSYISLVLSMFAFAFTIGAIITASIYINKFFNGLEDIKINALTERECWDLNKNGKCDPALEDYNKDGKCDRLDCIEGYPTVFNGTDCWDRNANYLCDLLLEDINGDGVCNASDCNIPLYRGIYDSQSTYHYNDFVYYDSSTYLCISRKSINGINPKQNNTLWSLITLGFKYKGQFNSSLSYTQNDIVTYLDSAYVCISLTATSQPPSNLTVWTLFAKGYNSNNTEINNLEVSTLTSSNQINSQNVLVQGTLQSESIINGVNADFNDSISTNTLTVRSPANSNVSSPSSKRSSPILSGSAVFEGGIAVGKDINTYGSILAYNNLTCSILNANTHIYTSGGIEVSGLANFKNSVDISQTITVGNSLQIGSSSIQQTNSDLLLKTTGAGDIYLDPAIGNQVIFQAPLISTYLINTTSSVNAETGTFTTSVSATTGSFSGTVSANVISSATSVNGNTGTFTGSLSANSIASATSTTTASLSVTSTIDSISPNSGSATFSGGVGIEKNAYIGGNLNVDGVITATTLNVQVLNTVNTTVTEAIHTGLVTSTDTINGNIANVNTFNSINATISNLFTANSADVINGVSANSISSATSVSGTTGAFTGEVSSNSISAVTGDFTGDLSANSIASVTSISGATGAFTGTVTSNAFSATTSINGTTGDFTGTLSANSISSATSTTTSTFSTTSTTDATSSTIAPNTFSGGVGIAKTLYVGTNITAGSAVNANSLSATTSISGATGSFTGTVSSNALTSTTSTTTATLVVTDTTDSTSYIIPDGSFQTSGGIFAAKSLAVASNIRTGGVLNIQGVVQYGPVSISQINNQPFTISTTGGGSINLNPATGNSNKVSMFGGIFMVTEASANLSVPLYITSTAASTSTTTGSAVLSGGIGVAGNANIGGTVNANALSLTSGSFSVSSLLVDSISPKTTSSGITISTNDTTNGIININPAKTLTGVRINGDNSTNAVSIAISRSVATGQDLEMGAVGTSTQFFSGSLAGDVIIRNTNSSNRILLGVGDTTHTLAIYSSGVDISQITISGATISSPSGSMTIQTTTSGSNINITPFGTAGVIIGGGGLYINSINGMELNSNTITTTANDLTLQAVTSGNIFLSLASVSYKVKILGGGGLDVNNGISITATTISVPSGSINLSPATASDTVTITTGSLALPSAGLAIGTTGITISGNTITSPSSNLTLQTSSAGDIYLSPFGTGKVIAAPDGGGLYINSVTGMNLNSNIISAAASNDLTLQTVTFGNIFLSLASGTDKVQVVGGSGILVNPTTASTSTTTGSIVTNGGIGVAGAANIGGTCTANSFSATTSISADSGSFTGNLTANTITSVVNITTPTLFVDTISPLTGTDININPSTTSDKVKIGGTLQINDGMTVTSNSITAPAFLGISISTTSAGDIQINPATSSDKVAITKGGVAFLGATDIGYTPTNLNYFEEGSLSLTASGAISNTYTIFYTRIGQIVTLTFPDITNSTNVGGGISLATLPTRFIPTAATYDPLSTGTITIFFVVRTRNLGTFTNGGIDVFLSNHANSGKINIYNGPDGTGFTSGSGSVTGLTATSITYRI